MIFYKIEPYNTDSRNWMNENKMNLYGIDTRDLDRHWNLGNNGHRDYDLPAGKYPSIKAWFKDGLNHRINNKPAIIFPDGRKEYWVNGKRQIK